MNAQNCLIQTNVCPTMAVCMAGVNGCSLKTEEHLSVMAQIPEDRLLLETDSPYCDVRPSHAGKAHVKSAQQAKDRKKYDQKVLVKGRNEPCNIVSVFEVVTGKCSLANFAKVDQLLRLTAHLPGCFWYRGSWNDTFWHRLFFGSLFVQPALVWQNVLAWNCNSEVSLQ